MIICPATRFVFIHIPKTGGSLIKDSIQHLALAQDAPEQDAIARAFDGDRWLIHHATPSDLAARVPDVFAAIEGYDSLAVLRQPQGRFVSSLNQRIREFKGLPQSSISEQVLNREAEEVIRMLMTSGADLPRELVHFRRQSDYIAVPGRWRIGVLFPFARLDAAYAYLQDRLGVTVAMEAESALYNASVGPRVKGLRPIVKLAAPAVKALMPSAADSIRGMLIRMGVFGRIDNSKISLALDPSHVDFLADYYAEDERAYQAALARTAPAEPGVPA